MKQETACDRCGLRAVRHELERRGIVMRFCDLCYWGELQPPDQSVGPEERPAESATARDGLPINR